MKFVFVSATAQQIGMQGGCVAVSSHSNVLDLVRHRSRQGLPRTVRHAAEAPVIRFVRRRTGEGNRRSCRTSRSEFAAPDRPTLNLWRQFTSWLGIPRIWGLSRARNWTNSSSVAGWNGGKVQFARAAEFRFWCSAAPSLVIPITAGTGREACLIPGNLRALLAPGIPKAGLWTPLV
jgi:hypothetical protein